MDDEHDVIQNPELEGYIKKDAAGIRLAALPHSTNTIYATYIMSRRTDEPLSPTSNVRLVFDTYVNVSSDGGQTWLHGQQGGVWSQKRLAAGPKAKAIPPVQIYPYYYNKHLIPGEEGVGFHTYPAYSRPEIACDQNRAYVVWRDGCLRDNPKAAYYDLYIACSADWTQAVRVNDKNSIGGIARSSNHKLAAFQGQTPGIQGQIPIIWDDRLKYDDPEVQGDEGLEGAPDTYFNLLLLSGGE